MTFDLSNHGRSVSRSLGFLRLMSRKGAEVGHMLKLHTIREPKMHMRLTSNHANP